MPRVLVQEAAFDIGAETCLLAGHSDQIGAVASFTGFVRADDGLISLTLEHYPGMTEALLSQIAATAIARFHLYDVTLIHRVGCLPPGAPIVLVLAAARHRGDALEATQFLIDWLKTDAPFWKKERREGGEAWVEARESDREKRDSWGEAKG